ncbi:MAG: DUF4280 domain-containing protein [Lachnospiraceae bacterium]|nr:DUF4280 domain-containing protein [Lachnospiraceae bacterium]
MKDDGKKYVVYGMKAKCSEGSMENYISTDVGHGVLYQGQPLLNANDHTPQVNLTHFGDCHSKKIYEEAKKQADEKYKADADDGFFEKAGKLLAKTVTKAAISMKENFCANKCELDTPLPWMFVNKEHMIDGAPALTVESQCACRYGGIITIVPEPEEEVTIETEEVALAENMAEPDEVEVKELEKEKNEVRLSAGVGWLLETWPEEVYEEAKNKMLPKTEEEQKKYYIEKYVNEETLKDINSRWDMETFKRVYGENVLDEMKSLMYEYGITDEVSILMFLSTIGVESNYGANIVQGGNEQLDSAEYRENLEEVPDISSSKGIGLTQITGDSQGYFIKELYLSLADGCEEKERILKYFNQTDEYFKSIPSYLPAELDNTTGFIYAYYPIESSMWYWGKNDMQCASFEGEKQKNYSINDYVVKFKEKNKNNVFLASQYSLNSRPLKKGSKDRMSKGHVEGICNISEDIATKDSIEITIETGTYPMPEGWKERMEDWTKASCLLDY